MDAKSIKPRHSYVRRNAMVRYVESVRDGIVTYAIEDVLSLQPFHERLEQFAEWAEREVH